MSFNGLGYFVAPLSVATAIRGCAICSVVAAVVESFPLREVDNLTIPFAVAVAAQWVF
jgi:dolichol kinase